MTAVLGQQPIPDIFMFFCLYNFATYDWVNKDCVENFQIKWNKDSLERYSEAYLALTILKWRYVNNKCQDWQWIEIHLLNGRFSDRVSKWHHKKHRVADNVFAKARPYCTKPVFAISAYYTKQFCAIRAYCTKPVLYNKSAKERFLLLTTLDVILTRVACKLSFSERWSFLSVDTNLLYTSALWSWNGSWGLRVSLQVNSVY